MYFIPGTVFMHLVVKLVAYVFVHCLVFREQKKNRERLEDTKNLVDTFSRKTSQSMHGPSGPSQIRSMHIANTRTASGSNDAKFLPMDHTALKKMLNVHTGALPDGVIQKFVGVSGEVHTLLRVQWEESLFKVSKVLMDTVGMSPGHSKPASQEGVSITLQVDPTSETTLYQYL